MKNYFKLFFNGLVIGLGFLFIVLGAYVVMGWTSNYDGLEAESGNELTLAKWNALVAKMDSVSSGSIPTGTVAAFKLSSCPTGWSEANGTDDSLDLRGAFIRGMNGDDNGRDITRTLGSYQADDFASHNHQHKWNAGGVGSCSEIQMTATCQGYTTTENTGGTETRPKNVALLYCVKE